MNDWPRCCAAVISCFNEAELIGPVVGQIRRHLTRVIVVDDGSTDNTAEIARDAGASIVRLRENGGKGAALRAGWQCAGEHGFAWVLMLDGDGQHAPAEAPKFFDCADRTDARLVIGNRMSRADTMPWLRRRVNTWMSRRISTLTGTFLPDSQCGFRLARLEILRGLRLTTSHFEIESEMLAAFLNSGHRVEFVPVQTIYNVRRSRIRPLPDAWRWCLWLRAEKKARAHVGRASAPLWTRPLPKTVS